MSVSLPATVTHEQLVAACDALGLPRGAGVRSVLISYGGEDAGATIGVAVRNGKGQFVAHEDEPLTAYAHVPIARDTEVTDHYSYGWTREVHDAAAE